jgi:TrmH family RNA methyltransferase
VQRLRRLVGRRSARQQERAFVVEGINVLGEALASGAPVESVYIDRSGLAGDRAVAVIEEARGRGIRVYDLAAGVMARVAGTVTPQAALAVVPYVDVPLDALRGADFLIVCAEVRDPGNAGTVLRSAQAAGAGGVICCHGSVDVFNPKTVRASAGALFRVPVVAGGDAVEVLEELGRWDLHRIGTAARGGTDYTTVDLTSPVALVLGNEAHGLGAGLSAAVDGMVSIPMAPGAESLNVGMAAAVLCFEVARQRRLGANDGGLHLRPSVAGPR